MDEEQDRESEPTRTSVYTRDATDTSGAFVTQTMFEAGQVVTLELPAAEGMSQRLEGQILRCQQFRDGWFEGVFRIQPPPAPAPPSPHQFRQLVLDCFAPDLIPPGPRMKIILAETVGQEDAVLVEKFWPDVQVDDVLLIVQA